jgi:hypothetical protein
MVASSAAAGRRGQASPARCAAAVAVTGRAPACDVCARAVIAGRAGARRPGGRGQRHPGPMVAGSVVLEMVAQVPAGAVEPRRHRPDRCSREAGDLPVGVALDVGEVHRGAVAAGKLVECAFDAGVRHV